MAERVESVEVGVLWEPNAPEAVIAADDFGVIVLAARAHAGDADRRTVALRWFDAIVTKSEPFNDEARHRHPLHSAGLQSVLWIGAVVDSNWLKDLAPALAVNRKLVHYVVPLKERVVEVIASGFDVVRFDGEPTAAVLEVLCGRGGPPGT